MHCQRQAEAGREHAEARWRESEQPPWDCKLAPWDRKSSGPKGAEEGANFGAGPRQIALRNCGESTNLRSQFAVPRPATSASHSESA